MWLGVLESGTYVMGGFATAHVSKWQRGLTCAPSNNPFHASTPPQTWRPPPAQHLLNLLAASDPDVVDAALAALGAYVRRTHHQSVRLPGSSEAAPRLLAMVKGWAGREEVRQGAGAAFGADGHQAVCCWARLSAARHVPSG